MCLHVCVCVCLLVFVYVCVYVSCIHKTAFFSSELRASNRGNSLQERLSVVITPAHSGANVRHRTASSMLTQNRYRIGTYAYITNYSGLNCVYYIYLAHSLIDGFLDQYDAFPPFSLYHSYVRLCCDIILHIKGRAHLNSALDI